MQDKTIHKTRITVTVLSTEPYGNTNLQDIYYDITGGDCSGQVEIEDQEILTGNDAVQAVKDQGSDPCYRNRDANQSSPDWDDLFAAAVGEIQDGIDNGDLAAVEELLAGLPRQWIIGFLPEEQWERFNHKPNQLP